MGAIYQQAYNTKIDQLIEPTSFTQSINQSRPVIRTHTHSHNIFPHKMYINLKT